MTNTMQSNNLTRPLALKQGTSEVSILVASDVWLAAEQLREEFLISSTESAAAAAPVEGAADEQAPEMELVARFLKFATDKCEQVTYPFHQFHYINWNTTSLDRKQGRQG
jgi:fatty acid synthase subunit beta